MVVCGSLTFWIFASAISAIHNGKSYVELVSEEWFASCLSIYVAYLRLFGCISHISCTIAIHKRICCSSSPLFVFKFKCCFLTEALVCLSTVIMPNYYDLPFNDILDWSQFSVVLKETNIYLLKDILRSISEKHFITLNHNIVKVLSIKVLKFSFSTSKN